MMMRRRRRAARGMTMMIRTTATKAVRRSARNGRRRHRLGLEWRSRSPPRLLKKTTRAQTRRSLTGLKLSLACATSLPQRKGPSIPPIASLPSRNSTRCPVKGRSPKSLGDGRVSKKGKGGHRTWRGWWMARGDGRRGTRSCAGRNRRAGEARIGRRRWQWRSPVRGLQEGWRVPRGPVQLQLGNGLWCPPQPQPRPRLRARRLPTQPLPPLSPPPPLLLPLRQDLLLFH